MKYFCLSLLFVCCVNIHAQILTIHHDGDVCESFDVRSIDSMTISANEQKVGKLQLLKEQVDSLKREMTALSTQLSSLQRSHDSSLASLSRQFNALADELHGFDMEEEVTFSKSYQEYELSRTIPAGAVITYSGPFPYLICRTNKGDKDFQLLLSGDVAERPINIIKNDDDAGILVIKAGKDALLNKIEAMSSAVAEMEADVKSANNNEGASIAYREMARLGLRPIKILAMGNSWTLNSTDFIIPILKDLGITCEIHKSYLGGASLAQYANSVKNGSQPFAHYHNNNLVISKETSAADILSADNFDIITFQQFSMLSGQYETFQPYLNELLRWKSRVTDISPLTYLNVTWAYPQGATTEKFEAYDYDNLSMYNAIIDAYQQAVAETGVKHVFLLTPVIQQVRQIEGISGVDTEDGSHLSTYGMYAASCMWVETLLHEFYYENVTQARTILDCKWHQETLDPSICAKIRQIVSDVYQNRTEYFHW